MPTPTGLPKVGEWIRFAFVTPRGKRTDRVGRVVERTGGIGWSVRVMWEDRKPYEPATDWILTAGYYMDRGQLTIEGR